MKKPNAEEMIENINAASGDTMPITKPMAKLATYKTTKSIIPANNLYQNPAYY